MTTRSAKLSTSPYTGPDWTGQTVYTVPNGTITLIKSVTFGNIAGGHNVNVRLVSAGPFADIAFVSFEQVSDGVPPAWSGWIVATAGDYIYLVGTGTWVPWISGTELVAG